MIPKPQSLIGTVILRDPLNEKDLGDATNPLFVDTPPSLTVITRDGSGRISQLAITRGTTVRTIVFSRDGNGRIDSITSTDT